MYSRRIRNIGISIGVLIAWVCIVLILSSLSNQDSNNISVVYIWAIFSGLIAGLGGLVFLALRIFKSIHRKNNFGYIFWGIANFGIGISGVFFYFVHRINMIGLHDLLPNLLIGVVILVDLFLFEILFPPKGSN